MKQKMIALSSALVLVFASSTAQTATPPNSLVIDDTGKIGVGTDAPSVTVHVKQDRPEFRVENTVTTTEERVMMRLQNNGTVNFKLNDTSGGNGEWTFRTGTAGSKFVIGKTGSGVQEMQVFSGGNMQIAGTLSQSSSRTKKENIRGIDTDEILEKVMNLPVSQWSYIHDQGSVEHIGPMAEDFHSAFGVGSGPKLLSSIDTGGVALAAIKGLNQKLIEKDREIAELKAQLARFEQQEQRLGWLEENLKILLSKQPQDFAAN